MKALVFLHLTGDLFMGGLMKTRTYALTGMLLAFSFQMTAFAHKNVYVQYTLKNVTKDVAVVREPTVPDKPGDVLDGTILNAIIRTRSAGFFLQTLNDRKGKVEGGKLILDEMTPAEIEEEPNIEIAKEMLARQGQYLSQSKAKLETAEQVLRTELAKPNPDTRDFTLVKVSLVELDKLLLEIQP